VASGLAATAIDKVHDGTAPSRLWESGTPVGFGRWPKASLGIELRVRQRAIHRLHASDPVIKAVKLPSSAHKEQESAALRANSDHSVALRMALTQPERVLPVAQSP
jgi:hypothetical protein